MEQKHLKQLMKPSAYPEETQHVVLKQTHISFLLLTDNFVYKIKKPVDLGFLNFTTLDRRRFYCEEEVRLNRRLCPDIYLGVSQIRESSGGIAINGKGTTIEYAVKMRRLPEDRMLDTLLQENKVDADDIRMIAAEIARFHLAADRSAEISRYGDISVIKRNWEENFRQVADFVGDVISRREMDLIEKWVCRFLSENEKLFADRVAGGFIRDCDGDIHAENICLADKVYIFDCIEFNERFRHIDTAADIAFLLMDFDYHGKKAFSDEFVKEYLARTGDEQLLQILDFYKIYRAFVRGKVECFKLNDRNIDPEEKSSSRQKAIRHFRLVRGYILRRNLSPGIILLTGLMGTGKSTIAAELAFELGQHLARSDVARKELAGMQATERDFSAYNEGIYSPEFTRATYEKLRIEAESSLKAGEGVIVDASFQNRKEREAFSRLAKKFDTPFFIIHTTCPDELVRQRLESRMLDKAEPSDGRWELYHSQKADYEDVHEEEGKLLILNTATSLQESMESVLHFVGLR